MVSRGETKAIPLLSNGHLDTGQERRMKTRQRILKREENVHLMHWERKCMRQHGTATKSKVVWAGLPWGPK